MRQTAVLLLACLAAIPASAQPTLKAAAVARRQAVLKAVTDGLLVVQSADRSQPNLLEFMLPDTENHDFVYLTGLDRAALPGSVLVLNPGGERYREVLYTADDVERAKQATGIEHVFSASRFLDDLSSALTDYRDIRITQLRRKPVASDFSRGLGVQGTRKIIYLNYPRFTNLAEPQNPRFALAERLRQASPEVELRDSGEILDRLRMVHDEYEMGEIRRAVAITGAGLTEAFKVARAGVTTGQVREVIDFVYRLNGAGMAFETNVEVPARSGQAAEPSRPENGPRLRDVTIQAGDFIHIDTGSEVNHYASDVQRMIPADGRFTSEQRKVYEKILAVQKAVIAAVRPGARWQDLHDLAVRMLREAGDWDKTYTYGIGHFVGMEVHDHGDYLQPLRPGMTLAIEQGTTLNGVRVALEDTVLVTPDGNEWLSRSIPIEVDEIERVLPQPPTIDVRRLLLPPR